MSSAEFQCGTCPLTSGESTFCAVLSPDARRDMSKGTYRLTLKPGQTVPSSLLRRLPVFTLIEGSVAFQVSMPDGRVSLPAILLAGEVCDSRPGEGDPLPTLVALEPSVLCMISGQGFDTALDRDRSATRFILAEWRETGMTSRHHAVDLGRKSPEARIASLVFEIKNRLRRMARKAGGPRQAAEAIVIPMSRTQIADYLGLNPETVSRSFKRLERLDVIGLPRPNHVVIRDRDALSKIAGGDEITAQAVA